MAGPSPPEWMRPSESSLADGARAHILEIQKKRSSFLATFDITRKEEESKDKGKGKHKHQSLVPLTAPPSETEPTVVGFEDKRKYKEDKGQTDQFKWAILYENQRGVTVFSTPYYSCRSLLPHDPPPFTLPDTGQSSPDQNPNHAPPNVTLVTYPLPDPTWRWVSKSWLVDMRGDGDVQFDGFEYNWFFRRNGWRAQVGLFGAGGYVRRRRWVRLMMRPSAARLLAESAIEDSGRDDVTNGSESSNEGLARRLVWKGDDGDWNRVRNMLKSLTRDGPRLDLWVAWLSDLIGNGIYTTHRLSESTEDSFTRNTQPGDIPSISEEHPRREWILAVLRDHGKELHSYFVYPDSRAQLRDLFVMAGLVQNTVLGISTPVSHISSSTVHLPHSTFSHLLDPGDFWSRSSELNLVVSTEDMFNTGT